MFYLYARNGKENYFIKASETKDEAFDYGYKYRQSFYQKGGWSIEVWSVSGLVKDDRLLA